MTLQEVKQTVYETLLEAGIMIDSIEEDFDLQDFIQDSIQFISFIVSLEEKFNIEIPDEMLTFDEVVSFNNFCQRIYDVLHS
mgnify:FL=1|jgi:phosphopantetheine attachment domain protein